MLQRYYAKVDESFFQTCDKELVKINTFFAEKLAEAQRKFENLKSEIKDENTNLIDKRKDKRSKSMVTEIAADDENEDEDSHTNNGKADAVKMSSNETPLRNRNRGSENTQQQQQQLTSIINGAQNITLRFLEKTRQRKIKQKQFRKEHDLKLAFSEFYLSLILLQNYQTLNFTGFRKILKKHDKVENIFKYDII